MCSVVFTVGEEGPASANRRCPKTDQNTNWLLPHRLEKERTCVATHGFPVAEAPRTDARKNRGVGKSDALDAHRIAMAVLPLPVDKLRRPRLHDGVRQGVRILVTARCP